mmetsp:Transcript_8235/g.33332  ORF Transcript_8235/g.33332 Transcript_8235/m.33332 type:complete len:218 (-) Transcript_8235:367-1020(-)
MSRLLSMPLWYLIRTSSPCAMGRTARSTKPMVGSPPSAAPPAAALGSIMKLGAASPSLLTSPAAFGSASKLKSALRSWSSSAWLAMSRNGTIANRSVGAPRSSESSPAPAWSPMSPKLTAPPVAPPAPHANARERTHASAHCSGPQSSPAGGESTGIASRRRACCVRARAVTPSASSPSWYSFRRPSERQLGCDSCAGAGRSAPAYAAHTYPASLGS